MPDTKLYDAAKTVSVLVKTEAEAWGIDPEAAQELSDALVVFSQEVFNGNPEPRIISVVQRNAE